MEQQIIDLRGKTEKQIDEMLLNYLGEDLQEIGNIGHEKHK